MMDRIDVHSHLLPGIDDGCKTIEESLACARMLVAAGYSQSFCTPHAWPGNHDVTNVQLPLRTAQLQSVLNQAGIDLRLSPGSELNLHPKVMEMPADRIISMSLAGRYILADMWAERLPDWFEDAIAWLQSMRLIVILAHPERMRAVQDRPELADYFAEKKILLQGNLQCFADRPGADNRRVAEMFLKEDRYFVLGSDCHDAAGLRTRLVGLQNAITLAGDKAIDLLTKENPKFLLA